MEPLQSNKLSHDGTLEVLSHTPTPKASKFTRMRRCPYGIRTACSATMEGITLTPSPS
jgi:hypothetical protein